jgi:hypothetical protein
VCTGERNGTELSPGLKSREGWEIGVRRLDRLVVEPKWFGWARETPERLGGGNETSAGSGERLIPRNGWSVGSGRRLVPLSVA